MLLSARARVRSVSSVGSRGSMLMSAKVLFLLVIIMENQVILLPNARNREKRHIPHRLVERCFL